jgi:hypothetical protein
LRVAIASDGEAKVEAIDRISGIGAVRWRGVLEKVDKARLRDLFEQRYLGQVFPGAALGKLAVVDRARPDRPLELRYTFSQPGLCTPSAGQLRCMVKVNPLQLQRRYAQLARRRFPLQIAFDTPLTLELELVPPPGYRVDSVPPPARVQSRFGSFVRRGGPRGAGGTVSLSLAARVRFGRVPTSQYPELAAFARAVDRHLELALGFSRR